MSFENLQYSALRVIINAWLYLLRNSCVSPGTQPNQTKTIAGRKDLFRGRIFIPPHTKYSQDKLPLVICVHGGGFVVNNPSGDDRMARHISDKAGCVTVSIDYRKAPQAKFPCAYEDVIEQTLSIINDPDLCHDPSRVVLIGASAGGNLVLAAAQHPKLRDRIAGVITLYPACDFGPSCDERMATRPDPSIPDCLGDKVTSIRELYLGSSNPTQVSLQDPRLSPTYFESRDHLPENMLFVGAEHDLLCHEAEVMADKLAAAGHVAKMKTEHGWKAGGVQWHKAKDQLHAFDHFPEKKPEREENRRIVRLATYDMFCDWLDDLFDERSEKPLTV